MGIFSSLFGHKKTVNLKVNIKTSITASLSHRAISEHDLQLEHLGYKRGIDNRLYPPDTVFINKGSDVYHANSFCRGVSVYGGPRPMSEGEAIKLGYRRCEVCNWDKFAKPEFYDETPLVPPATHTSSIKSKEAFEYINQGYPVFQGFVYPKDTVFVLENSKTYHSSADSKSCHIDNSRFLPIPEAEAVRRGLHRCKRCSWNTSFPPAPSPYPVEFAKPICCVYIK